MVTVVIGLVSAKAWAVLLEPSGLGFMSLLQSVAGLSTLVAGLGIGVGLTRAGAGAIDQGDLTRVAALRAAGWVSLSALGLLMALVLVVFRTPVSLWGLGGADHAWSLVLVGAAVVLTLTSGVSTGILNAYHRLAALAKLSILNKLFGTAVSLLLVWLWRLAGIAPAMVTGAAIGWILAYRLLLREVGRSAVRPTAREIGEALATLLRFGVPYTASMLVGTGVQLAMPVLVLHRLGAESVGFYQAAIGVSFGYLDFLLRAMSQDYFPRVSAAHDQPETLVRLINEQHRVVMLLAIPLVLGTLALLPYLIPIVYSSRFAPTVSILEWLLVADLLKFSSWTMAFVVLARCGSLTFFFTELTGGLMTLVASWLGMRWFGLAGLGIASLLTYGVYYFIVWCIVRREIRLRLTVGNKRLLLGALLVSGVFHVLSASGLPNLAMAVLVVVAALAGLGGGHTVWREMRQEGPPTR